MAIQRVKWDIPGTAPPVRDPDIPDSKPTARQLIVASIMRDIELLRLVLWHPGWERVTEGIDKGISIRRVRGRDRTRVIHDRDRWGMKYEVAECGE